MTDRTADYYSQNGATGFKMFSAPVDTPPPVDVSSDGMPLTLDDTGVTEWVEVTD